MDERTDGGAERKRIQQGEDVIWQGTNDSRWLASRGSVNRDGGGYGWVTAVGWRDGMGMCWKGLA